jgi:hypothetical protein
MKVAYCLMPLTKLLLRCVTAGSDVQEYGFYVSERSLSNGATTSSARSSGSTDFGTWRPVQMPTQKEVELDTEGFVSVIKRLCSPVYYSTTAEGKVVWGLGGIPDTRPLLLVGNHQLFAADMYPMIAEFVKEKGVLPRGLAHPVVFAGPEALQAASGRDVGNQSSSSEVASGSSSSGDSRRRGGGAGQFSSLLSTYGAVPVSGRNMHKLLESGEVVLLYPGGAREVRRGRYH